MKKTVKTIFWGVFFLAAAGFLLASQMGLVATGISAWKLILAVCLLAIAIEGLIHVEFFSILLPIAGILCLFAESLGLASVSVWAMLGAAALAATGLSIIFGKYTARFHGCGHHAPGHWKGSEDVHEDENSFKLEGGFSSIVKYVHAQSLERAKIESAFGSVKVYFDQAQLSPNGADVYVQAGFGNVVLYIPKAWNVVDSIQSHMGAVKGHGNQVEEGAPTMRLTGDVAFGAIEIMYV